MLMTTMVGTPFYLAPCLIRGRNGYTERVDIWSVGCICYQLAYGATPFEDSNSFAELYLRIAEGNWTFPAAGLEKTSESFKELVCRLLETDANARPSAGEALKLGFFNDIPQRVGIGKRRPSGAVVVFSEDTRELVEVE